MTSLIWELNLATFVTIPMSSTFQQQKYMQFIKKRTSQVTTVGQTIKAGATFGKWWQKVLAAYTYPKWSAKTCARSPANIAITEFPSTAWENIEPTYWASRPLWRRKDHQISCTIIYWSLYGIYKKNLPWIHLW